MSALSFRLRTLKGWKEVFACVDMLARSASSCFASVPRQSHGHEACLPAPSSAADVCACLASCIHSDYQLFVAGCLTGLTALESLALRNFYLVGEELQPHILEHLNDPNLGPPPSVSRRLPAVAVAYLPVGQLSFCVSSQQLPLPPFPRRSGFRARSCRCRAWPACTFRTAGWAARPRPLACTHSSPQACTRCPRGWPSWRRGCVSWRCWSTPAAQRS